MEAGFNLHLPAGPVIPQVIAEIGGNHRNDFQTGRTLLRQLQDSGIEWVKFQLWKAPEVWVVQPDGVVEPDPGIVGDLLGLAKEMGLRTVLSIFGTEGLGGLDLSNIDRWKIGASRVGDRDLVERLARMETFISSGFADPHAFVRQASTYGLTPLICVSKYPADGKEYALGTWKEILDPERPWGISDHSPDHGPALAAVALGASWIERHVDFLGGNHPQTRDRGPHVDSPLGLGELQRLAASVSGAVCKTPVLKNPVRRVIPLL